MHKILNLYDFDLSIDVSIFKYLYLSDVFTPLRRVGGTTIINHLWMYKYTTSI